MSVPPPTTPGTSKLAVGSLLFSAIACCPATTLLGPLLGVLALRKIRRESGLRGRKLALCGITLGLLFTGLQAFAGSWLYENIIELTFTGPRDALETGFTGDVSGFKDHFHGAGADASDAEASAFLDELRARYGAFESSELDPERAPVGGPVMTFEYELVFRNETRRAEVQLIFADTEEGGWPGKLGYITVLDPEGGDLTYP